MASETRPLPLTQARGWVVDGGAVLLAAMAVVGFAAFTEPQFDPDFWWHLRVGLQILSHGVPQHNDFTFTAFTHPFITQEWGAEAIYALLYRAWGMAPVILLMAAVTFVGFALGVLRCGRQGLSRWVLGVAAALVIVSGIQIWGPSPQMFTFGLLGVLLVLLDRYRRHPSRWILLGLVPLFVVWGNLHGGFLVGVAVLAVDLVGELVSRWLSEGSALAPSRLLDLGGALLLCALAPMVNPNGVGIYLYPVRLLLSSPAQGALNEWQPPDFHSLSSVPVLILLLGTLLVARWARHTRPADILLALAGTVLLLYAVRDIPLFAVLVLPLFTDGLQGLIDHVRLARRLPSRRTRSAPSWFVAAVLLLVVAVGAVRVADQLRSPDNSVQGSSYPVQVGRVICDGPQARVFTPYGKAGWLLYRIDRSAPSGKGCANDRVFVFGEVDLMGNKLLEEYLTVTAADRGTMAILERYRVSLVWQARGAPLVSLLGRQPGWTCVFATKRAVLLASPQTAAAWHVSRAGCPS